jgi:hypothetical protein
VAKKTTQQDPTLDLLISRLESFEASIRSIDSRVGELAVISAKQEVNLKEHMKRSDMLEASMKKESEERSLIEQNIDMRLKPIEKHVNFIDVVIKASTALVLSTIAILAVIEGMAKLKSFFNL